MLGIAVTSVVSHIEHALEAQRAAEAERRQAERTALQAQKMELVGSLASGVAHDFNNVLAVVQGWSAVGFGPRATDRVRAQAADAMDLAVRQGAALARQLLALGRRSVRAVRPCQLAEVVATSATALQRVLPENVELAVAHEGEAWIDADETELQQLVFNLVINARDAMPSGGRLRVSTGVESWSAPRAAVGGELAPGRWVFLAVEDTGSGISPEIRERVFEPFFTTKAAGSGTGLGLWTVLEIARAGGGGLVLDSEVGAGTTFRVYFPERAAGGPRAEARDATAPAATRTRARILLLEDNDPFRQLMRDVLVGAGHEVVAASHGGEALEALEGARFDLLCSDAAVPKVPAREVIEAFERKAPGAPVLIVSGFIGEELTRRGIEQGRYRLLRKPFRPEALTEAIDELLEVGVGATRAAREASAPSSRTTGGPPREPGGG
jgi:nitrogen-specific signal transduction histidine kinase/CheY-like chemotaxis protein